MTERLPYGAWPSPLAADAVVAGVVGFAELCFAHGTLYWLERRPEERGRTTLMAHDPASGNTRELTPAPANVRSRVHEYGGGAYHVAPEAIYYVDAETQNLHELKDSELRAVTSSGPEQRFADFCVDPQRRRLISVVEEHRNGAEPANYLGAVDLESGTVLPLHQEHDFYAAPRVDGAGRIAFLCWNHPNMPWDGCLLMTGTLGDSGVDKLTHVAGGAEESVTQPLWQQDGALLYVSDAGGFYNLYRFDADGSRCLLEDAADYAQPAWVFAQHDYAVLDGDHLVVCRQGSEGQELLLLSADSGLASPLGGEGLASCEALTSGDGSVYLIAGFPDRMPAIAALSMASGELTTLRDAGSTPLAAEDLSPAAAVSFPTRDGAVAHAYYYAPRNARCEGKASEAPPLLVMSHGGPTAATSSALNLRVQYYTSRGWAVVDVNYRGSSGYGRSYRTALNGGWGLVDVQDCEDAVRHLISQGRADPARVAIRGGSAGGFTTLAALTTTGTFRCGASHYGIGDLRALADDTHKFESRYLEGLLSSEADLVERSPINQLDGLSCPVIFFQGGEDKVVPPAQAEAMVAALKAKRIPVAYLYFPEEGHGFRQADNVVQALACEFAFFSTIFGIEPPEQLPELTISGLTAGTRP